MCEDLCVYFTCYWSLCVCDTHRSIPKCKHCVNRLCTNWTIKGVIVPLTPFFVLTETHPCVYVEQVIVCPKACACIVIVLGKLQRNGTHYVLVKSKYVYIRGLNLILRFV